MKVFKNKFYFIIIFLFGMMDIFAGTAPASGPPAPTGKVPPPPPGLPIDDYSFSLIIVAILYGFYTLYNGQTKSKPSA